MDEQFRFLCFQAYPLFEAHHRTQIMQKIGNFSKYVILIVLCTMSKTADALVKVKGEKYSKCKTASTNNDTLPMSMRSALECVQKCSQRKECFGVTTCRSSFPGESVQCWMSEAVLPEMCSSNISSLSAESCYYFQKVSKMSIFPVKVIAFLSLSLV